MNVVFRSTSSSGMEEDDELPMCNCPIEALIADSAAKDVDYCNTLIKAGKPRPDFKTWRPAWRKLNHESIDWLTGCNNLKRIFCWPCLLFGSEKGDFNVTGIFDKGKFDKLFRSHEDSVAHLRAAIHLQGLDRILNNCDSQMAGVVALEKAKRNNRETIEECLAAASMLLNAGLPNRDMKSVFNFYGFLDISKELKIGNFYGKVSECIATLVKTHIVKEIASAPILSIYLDEVSPMKMSVIFRFVSENNNVVERFYGFCENYNTITSVIKSISLPLNMRGRIVAVLVGRHSGGQCQPSRSYFSLHSPVHRLRDMISASLMSIQDCGKFFMRIEALDYWITKSGDSMQRFIKDYNKVAFRENLMESVCENRTAVAMALKCSLYEDENFDGQRYVINLQLVEAFKNRLFLFFLELFGDLYPKLDDFHGRMCRKYSNMSFYVNEYMDMLAYLVKLDFRKYLMKSNVEAVDLREQGKFERSIKPIFIMIVQIVKFQISLRYGDLIKLQFPSIMDFSETSVNSLCESELKNFTGLVKRVTKDPDKAVSQLRAARACEDFRGLQLDELMNKIISMGLDKYMSHFLDICRFFLCIPYFKDDMIKSSKALHDRIWSLRNDTEGRATHILEIHDDLVRELLQEDGFKESVARLFSMHQPDFNSK